MRINHLSIIIGSFIIMLVAIFVMPNNIYHYEGRVSFFPDTADKILSYEKTELIGVSDLNINMVEIKFDINTPDDISYLRMYQEKSESNTFNMVAKGTAIFLCVMMIIVGLIEIKRSKRNKLDKKLDIEVNKGRRNE